MQYVIHFRKSDGTDFHDSGNARVSTARYFAEKYKPPI